MNQLLFQPTSMTSSVGIMLLACLIAGCGDDSVAADPVSGETLPAMAIAQADVGDDAASDVADSRDVAVASPVTASALKRFGVMPHFGDLDTMVDRRVIRVLRSTGPVAIFWKMARGVLFRNMRKSCRRWSIRPMKPGY